MKMSGKESRLVETIRVRMPENLRHGMYIGIRSSDGKYYADVSATLCTTCGENFVVELKEIKDKQETKEMEGVILQKDGKKYRLRVRRLTPLECLRLMDVRDKDAAKIIGATTKTQVYKQAGNSIVVACMEGIFRNLFIEPEQEIEANVYQQLTIF